MHIINLNYTTLRILRVSIRCIFKHIQLQCVIVPANQSLVYQQHVESFHKQPRIKKSGSFYFPSGRHCSPWCAADVSWHKQRHRLERS